MTKKGLYAKDIEFWEEVNKKLNIPNDAYESKQSRQQAGREQVLLEKKAKEQAEEERLLANKKEIRSENRKDWKITVFELPESDIFGKRFVSDIALLVWMQYTLTSLPFLFPKRREVLNIYCLPKEYLHCHGASRKNLNFVRNFIT
ncbi:hypothetical protein GTQ43_08070 [Nostoc sp. KVJ3]|uniref:hypothetical protein n=1 Tax=Nostoc sp. KVJ3 TaxID=457945 RepID=UPI0022379C37|nr:hypothetical protein [Nostoc sp. KVJ3]MCW5313762.1 hypothetical protein [Nostoc sp. KVJ3]